MRDGRGRPVILDCDPGHDDALAILPAAWHFEILGVTAVAGNADLTRTTLNARRVDHGALLDLLDEALAGFPCRRNHGRPEMGPGRGGEEKHL
jgi:inosine-uridine nucleoside N-ribohydrolase